MLKVALSLNGGPLMIMEVPFENSFHILLIQSFSDDWGSVFGDPTKFGLGLFSVLFDIVFMLQHYVFYR